MNNRFLKIISSFLLLLVAGCGESFFDSLMITDVESEGNGRVQITMDFPTAVHGSKLLTYTSTEEKQADLASLYWEMVICDVVNGVLEGCKAEPIENPSITKTYELMLSVGKKSIKIDGYDVSSGDNNGKLIYSGFTYATITSSLVAKISITLNYVEKNSNTDNSSGNVSVNVKINQAPKIVKIEIENDDLSFYFNGDINEELKGYATVTDTDSEFFNVYLSVKSTPDYDLSLTEKKELKLYYESLNIKSSNGESKIDFTLVPGNWFGKNTQTNLEFSIIVTDSDGGNSSKSFPITIY